MSSTPSSVCSRDDVGLHCESYRCNHDIDHSSTLDNGSSRKKRKRFKISMSSPIHCTKTNVENKDKPLYLESFNSDCTEEPSRQKKKKKKRKKPSVIPINPPGLPNMLPKKQLEPTPITSMTRCDFPFVVDPDDHCESPPTAYNDILPLLKKLESIIHGSRKIIVNTNIDDKSNFQLHIYDPYYCDGAMKRHMSQLGFMNVYHEKVDCYDVWNGTTTSEMRYPDPLDVILTNPPYSGDHIEKLINHLTSSTPCTLKGRCNKSLHSNESVAWFLLLPTWVHKKEYFLNAMKTCNIQPFYIVPRKRYVYIPPSNFRIPKKSDVHKKSSPFTSMWYCYGGTPQINEHLIQHYLSLNRTKPDSDGICDIARSRSALRDLRRKQHSGK